MEFTSKFSHIALLGVIAIFSCAYVAESVKHDSIIGFCSNIASAPMMNTVVHKQNRKWFKMFRKTNLTVRFPERFKFPSPIRCIMIKDLARDGNGGTSTILSGGVNFGNVLIDFRSQPGGDIKFNVSIFGNGGVPYQHPFPNVHWNPPPQPRPQPHGWVYHGP